MNFIKKTKKTESTTMVKLETLDDAQLSAICGGKTKDWFEEDEIFVAEYDEIVGRE